jgi:hypothetical protein
MQLATSLWPRQTPLLVPVKAKLPVSSTGSLALWLSQLVTADGEESKWNDFFNTSEEGTPPGCSGTMR